MQSARLDVGWRTWQGAGMAVSVLFAVLALGLAVVAWAAWQGGLTIAAIGALVLALWMASMAIAGVRRARR